MTEREAIIARLLDLGWRACGVERGGRSDVFAHPTAPGVKAWVVALDIGPTHIGASAREAKPLLLAERQKIIPLGRLAYPRFAGQIRRLNSHRGTNSSNG